MTDFMSTDYARRIAMIFNGPNLDLCDAKSDDALYYSQTHSLYHLQTTRFDALKPQTQRDMIASARAAVDQFKQDVIDWAVSRWRSEVENRPLLNVHYRTLDNTWRQVIRQFGGDPDILVGPQTTEDVAKRKVGLLRMRYKNHRGEIAIRHIIPKSVRFGISEWYKTPQWLLLAWDTRKGADREFAMNGFSPVESLIDNEDEVKMMRLIQLLRSEEGNSVTILSDNADFNGQPNCAVICNGDWTDWQDRRFVYDTLLGALNEAELEHERRLRETPKYEGDWRDNPTVDARWNAGCDFAMMQLCKVLNVDPGQVYWDAATETVDGDVTSVIWNILRARMGENWKPGSSNLAPDVLAMRKALNRARGVMIALHTRLKDEPSMRERGWISLSILLDDVIAEVYEALTAASPLPDVFDEIAEIIDSNASSHHAIHEARTKTTRILALIRSKMEARP